jgi:putative transposase
VQEVVEQEKQSIARVCRVIELDRSMFYYESKKDDSAVEHKLQEYVTTLPNRGFPEYYKRIRKEGLIWNHKRVKRVYKKLGLAKRRRVKRRIPNPKKTPLLQPLYNNLTWSIDFMQDSLENGRKFRTFNVIDDYNREALVIEVGYSFPSVRVIEILKDLIEWKGKPEQIRSDNGTEFIAEVFHKFCVDHNIEHVKIQKGKPMQNGYIERFNKSFRQGVLDMMIFENLDQVRAETEKWMEDYNNNHPHDSLGDKTPVEFRQYFQCMQLTQNTSQQIAYSKNIDANDINIKNEKPNLVL